MRIVLDSYKGKKVKILVSSNSGAGTGVNNGSSMTVVSSIVTVFGELKDFNDQFIEVSNARTIYIDGFQTGYSTYNGSKDITPAVLDNSSLLVNRNNIITIALVS